MKNLRNISIEINNISGINDLMIIDNHHIINKQNKRPESK